MFKRLFWLTIGASFGFGLSFWLTRMIKQTMERYAPQRVSADLTSALRQFGQDLKDAAAEGREAMREHEAALRADLATRPAGAGTPNGPASTEQAHRSLQPTRSRRPSRQGQPASQGLPEGARQRPLRATGRLRVAEPDQLVERQEARR